MSEGTLIYLAVVGGVGLIIAVRMLFWLKASELGNLRRLRQRPKGLPVRTSSPIDDPIDTGREEGAAAIITRFSVARRLLLPIVLVIIGFAVAVPFLDMVPSATITLVAGAFAVVVGLAMRPLIENATAGLVMSSSKLISVGDTLILER